MERGESILDAIFEEDNFEDVQDVEMMDVEEGELVEQDPEIGLGKQIGGDANAVKSGSSNNKRRRRSNKKNRRKKGSSGQNVTDINRFVLDVCRCLKERKTYLVYTAVGSLGVSALSDLVKEVEAIQACGGQKTADGRRFRNGGGILWNILKTRDSNAYKEIMKKGKEFEKQFRQPNVRQDTMHKQAASPIRTDNANTDGTLPPDGSQLVPHVENQLEQSNVEGNRVSVHDRMRMLVKYDDLPGEEDHQPPGKEGTKR
ncbi:uncharacterized protein LOC127802890 [Diospyros lotus]|uniref:uncharacterized protein LOC127802890 n=1 Tax=Diospyros lotus TaxID=55363 RepID=UPI0022536962|nr:uncharacterized protein LOC127802890 [Diospyros lotus]